MTDVDEVVPGGVGVFVDAGFGGMGIYALAEATVVEGEDVDAEGVKGFELVGAIGERPLAVVEEEDGSGGLAELELGSAGIHQPDSCAAPAPV